MKFHFSILACLLIASCASDSSTTDTTPLNPAEDYRPVSGDPSTNDSARFLAGRPVKHGATLSDYQRHNGDYHTYALEFDHLWRTFAAKRTARQSLYYKDTLRPLLGSPSTIFYPFGGPDLLYVSALFPKASTYLLIGLESVGSIPDLSDKPQALLGRIARVMDEPLRHGYFITKEMRVAPPVTPILLTTLGLMNARIDSLQAINAGGYPGVEIRFRHPSGGSKRVIYVAANLSNSGFNSSFQTWLNSYQGTTAYFKAASYLMHDPAFSQVRNWTLSHCKSVLQDDSGIPYRDYNPSTWNATLLGTYKRPIPFFSKWSQPDLANAYSAIGGRGPEIPFGSGYHLRIVEANLQVYTRK